MLLVHEPYMSSKGLQQLAQPCSPLPTWWSQRWTSSLNPQAIQANPSENRTCSYGVATTNTRAAPVCHGVVATVQALQSEKTKACTRCSFLTLFSPSVLPCKLGITSTTPAMGFKYTQSTSPARMTWHTKCSINVNYYRQQWNCHYYFLTPLFLGSPRLWNPSINWDWENTKGILLKVLSQQPPNLIGR